MSLLIRAARETDAALIFALVCELAAYENLQGEVAATPEAIAGALFAPQPRLSCDIIWLPEMPTHAELSGRPVRRSACSIALDTDETAFSISVTVPRLTPEDGTSTAPMMCIWLRPSEDGAIFPTATRTA